MNYPDYLSLPSFGGKKYNTPVALIYEAFAVNFFLNTKISPDRNYSINQAAAICGNLQQESQFNPDIAGDAHIEGGSNGIAQWNDGPKHDIVNGRYAKMQTFVKKFFDTEDYKSLTDQQKFWGQLHYVDAEIHSPSYKKALAVLINNEDDADLAGKFGHIYEGFGDNSSAKRDNFAKIIVDSYNAGKFSDKKPQKFGVFLATPISYTPQEFKKFVDGLDLKKLTWNPKFITLHNTYIPTMATYLAYTDKVKQAWPKNLNNLYKNTDHWHSGPHLVCTPDGKILNLANLLEDGVHASCFNHTSFGIEMIGDFEKEDFNTGPGLVVQNTAIEAIAILCNKFNFSPDPLIMGKSGLHMHYMCKQDHHPCPGKNVVRDKLIPKIQARMLELKAQKK